MLDEYTPAQIQAFASLATLGLTAVLVGTTAWYANMTRQLVRQAAHARSVDAALSLHAAILAMENDIGTLRLRGAPRADLVPAMQTVHTRWAGYFSAHKMLLDDEDLRRRLHALTIWIAEAVNGLEPQETVSDSRVNELRDRLHADLKEFPLTLEAHIQGRPLPGDRFADAARKTPA
jgi:hypothetical protein